MSARQKLNVSYFGWSLLSATIPGRPPKSSHVFVLTLIVNGIARALVLRAARARGGPRAPRPPRRRRRALLAAGVGGGAVAHVRLRGQLKSLAGALKQVAGTGNDEQRAAALALVRDARKGIYQLLSQ